MFRTVFLAALVALAACKSPLRLPESARLFPFGVASGEPRSTSMRLWTRYLGDRPLRFAVWRAGEEEGSPLAEGPAPLADGGIAQVEVTGLSPATAYRYAFLEQGEGSQRSRLGRFRTPPEDTARPPLRFSLFSCARNGNTMHLMERAAESEVDAALFLGDSVYADSAETVSGYRQEWGENLGTLGFRQVRGGSAVIATWDDHEVANNWSGPSVSEARQQIAKQVFFESVPIAPHPEEPLRLWRSFRFGQTAEIFVLDSRGEREPKTRGGDNPIYLSEAQLSWLIAGLQQSPATFKLVMNSVPISDFPGWFDAAAEDRWEGYHAQRLRLLEAIEDVEGVLFLSGDFHLASVGRVSSEGPGSEVMELVVGPASNFTNPLAAILGPPQFDWSRDVNNFGLIDLDPEAGTVKVTYRDEQGLALFQRTYTP